MQTPRYNAFSRYLHEVVKVFVPYRSAPIKGRLIKIGEDYIEIERLSGNITTIRCDSVVTIDLAREYKPEQAVV